MRQVPPRSSKTDVAAACQDAITGVQLAERMRDELLSVTYNRFLPHADFLLKAGFVAPPVPTPPEANALRRRLLLLTGREP